MDKKIYVVVADNDQFHNVKSRHEPYYDYNGPIVFETYTANASMEKAVAKIGSLMGSYGMCRIARLEFIADLILVRIVKHIIIPRAKEIAGFNNLPIDVEDIELFDGIIQHLTSSYAAGQTQYHNRSGPSVKEHRKVRQKCLSLHISP